MKSLQSRNMISYRQYLPIFDKYGSNQINFRHIFQQFCFIVNNKNIQMKSTPFSPHIAYDFSLSTASSSFLSNSTLRDKKYYQSFQPKDQFEQSRIYASEKTRPKKNEITFRRSVNIGQPSTPPTSKNNSQFFLRNTSYFSVQEQPSFDKSGKVAYAAEKKQGSIPNLKTCTSIESSTINYEKILQKINKKQRLINQLKELTKVSVTDIVRSSSPQANEKYTKNSIMSKQERMIGQHKRGYHSEPNKNKFQPSNQNNPFKIDFYRSNAADYIKQPESPPVYSARQKFKTQMPEFQKYEKTCQFNKNPEVQQPKSENFKKYKYVPKQPKFKQAQNELLPLKLVFTKTQSSYEAEKQKIEGMYTDRYNFEPQTYSGPYTSRDYQNKNPYDIRHISDCKRIKNNASYFTHKKVSILDFQLVKALGEGKFGTVHQAIHKATNSIFAIKKIRKQIIKINLMTDQLVKQIKIQTICHHQNILELFGFFDDHEHIYLILQYMDSGTLFQELKKNRCFTEEQAAVKLRHVAKAIVYMHEKGIAHRDIKPENIVISSGIGKICDFGWATFCDGNRRKTYCGTFDYAAPQILEGHQYGISVDLWCLGILTYELLVGKAPFFHLSRKETMKRILNVENETISYPAHLSKKAVSFIQNLVKKNPEQRMSGANILNHPFLLERKQQY